MAWRNRKNSKCYCRSLRVGKRVLSEYLGSGPEAELSAKLDILRREQRRDSRETWLRLVSCLRDGDRLLENLTKSARLLTYAVLVLSGLHAHKGEWRRRRVYRNR